ncbi:MAG: hypothetical protein AAF488_13490 [Planctomycetota bacterium]
MTTYSRTRLHRASAALLGSLPVMLLIVGGLGVRASAAIRPVSLDQLVQHSTAAVVATVREQRSRPGTWPGVGSLPFTDFTLTVESVWFGPTERKEWIVSVPGGTDAFGRQVEVSDMARLRVGDRVLLFLHERTIGAGEEKRTETWVTGSVQGCYPMRKQRVVGRKQFPIPQDVLAYYLRPQVLSLVKRNPTCTPQR